MNEEDSVQKWHLKAAWATVLAIAVGLAPAAFAQVSTGNIYGKVTDESQAVLPGVTATLSGPFGTRVTTSDSQGEFRFLNVDHGTHKLVVTLAGFAGVSRDVVVTVGQNVNIAYGLKVAPVEETVIVTDETPVVDTRKLGTNTTISKAELAQMPSSRDPWALMRTIPGVLVDRVNVAGSESGQQSQFASKGADPKDAVWSIDGVVTTDMAAVGSSADYYSYDAFDEVNFSTGGNSSEIQTGGLGIGIVTKRGTNTFHGNASGYFTNDDLQSSNLPDELRGDPRLKGADNADHTEKITDMTFDLGGPIVKDKLWFYGSYGDNDIEIRNLLQTLDKTTLKAYSAKLNWQATGSDMISVFWFQGGKIKTGRTGSSGALAHLEGTLWNQGKAWPGSPHGLSKVEWNHVFGPSFFLTAKAARYNTGFNLIPQGGLDEDKFVVDNVRQEARGSALASFSLRPQDTLALDGSYFTPGFGGNHEIKFGVGYRAIDNSGETVYPGQRAQARFNATSTRARFFRDGLNATDATYLSAHLGDTFTRDRFTLNAGVRWDNQKSKKGPSTIVANPLVPQLLPALEFAGDADTTIEWNNISPRLGFTYALDDARKTVLRGSFARYAGQLPVGDAAWDNALGVSFLEYDWADRNGDEIVQLPEVDFSRVRNSSNIDLTNPGGIGESPNQIASDYHANIDNEAVLGLDRELAPNLALSVAYTWRKSTDLTSTQLLSGTYWYNWIGVTRADYLPGEQFCQNGYCATPFVLSEEAANRVTGGALLNNRDGYSRTYNGAELSLVKRLSNKWMGRVAFTFNDWKQHYEPQAIQQPNRTDLEPNEDSAMVLRSSGSGKLFYQNAKWQVAANGLYMLPAGFEVAASVFGRQGYPNPIYLELDAGALDGGLRILADGTKIDDNRFPNLWNADLRLAKNIKFGAQGRSNLTLSAEVFNVLNSNTELKRIGDAGSDNFGRLDEILAPRIVRFGARFTF
jgi:hypothetical protein